MKRAVDLEMGFRVVKGCLASFLRLFMLSSAPPLFLLNTTGLYNFIHFIDVLLLLLYWVVLSAVYPHHIAFPIVDVKIRLLLPFSSISLVHPFSYGRVM